MKRKGSLYSLVFDMENLEAAWQKTHLGKRFDKEAMEFSHNAFENLLGIHNALVWKTYRTGRYKDFKVYEPKERLIQYLPLKDRVVQQALHQVIEPIFDKSFIFDSYACRTGKGTHKAMRRLQQFIRSAASDHGDDIYYFSGDISKYFPNIDHDVLFGLVKKKIKCHNTLNLIKLLIDSSPLDPGLPIGALFSQLSANIYLNALDQFVKHTLRESFYLRYMDNFIVVHYDKAHLNWVYREIETFLNNVLRLKLNPKSAIGHIKGGVDFVGYRVYRERVKIRRDSFERMQKRLRVMKQMLKAGKITHQDIKNRIASWLGHIKHADAFTLAQKVLGGAVFVR